MIGAFVFIGIVCWAIGWACGNFSGYLEGFRQARKTMKPGMPLGLAEIERELRKLKKDIG